VNREAFSKTAGGEDRRSEPEALPLARVRGILDAAAVAGADSGRSGLAQDARRIGVTSVLHGPPSTPVSAEPDGLVARALAILAEETEAWQVRRGAGPASQSSE
jgi:hypothetical protein